MRFQINADPPAKYHLTPTGISGTQNVDRNGTLVCQYQPYDLTVPDAEEYTLLLHDIWGADSTTPEPSAWTRALCRVRRDQGPTGTGRLEPHRHATPTDSIVHNALGAGAP